jgi:predicted ATPase/class 3 adenylate cyclase
LTTRILAEQQAATVTFLFTDIEGSTRQWEQSPAMADLVTRHFDVLRAAVAAAGGEVFATLGDGIAAAFDAAGSAVAAAVAAQRDLTGLGLAVRMGIHTGEVERVDGVYRGRPVNRAARIMAVGHGGQILLSDVAASLVRAAWRDDAVELADVGARRLRDLAEPERLWQVVHPDLPRTFPALAPDDAVRAALPAARSSLVGRELDAQHIATLLRHERVVTLTGVGGVGKTRLAVRVAGDLAERVGDVWFVGLGGITDPGDVVDAVALAVGASGASGAALDAVTALLSKTAGLLVVDNCEHVVDAAASVVDALATACPQLRIVATSREALAVEGEQLVAVRPLPIATAAVELYRERAAAAGVVLGDGHRPAIEGLCARLDGLPLAIELAAARAATLGVAAIAEGLDDQALLRSGRRGATGRHGTMQATIEWSYRMLDADEQRLFRRLGAFADGFELDAVQHVAASLGISAPAATRHLESLVHKSMVVADACGSRVRFRLLETVRAFARDQLDAHGERSEARRAMAEWVATIAGLGCDDPASAAVERASIRLEREADNWREAVVVATGERSGPLAAGLCGPPADFFLLGRHDLADVVAPLLDVCVEPDQRRAVLSALIVTASGGIEPGRLAGYADEVAAIDESDPTGLGGLMRWLASAWGGDFATSVRVCVAAAGDERLPPATRDLFVAIAVLDHFSLTDATADTYGLVPRALEVAARTDVALTRVSCLLGVAWSLVDRDPGRSVTLVRRALDHIADVPALTRITLPGSASRLLSRLDPTIAAEALLDQLAITPRRGSYVDVIPLFYGAALLDRLGRDDVPAIGTVAAHRPAPSASMMDFVDEARRAAALGDAPALRELERTVRRGLTALAGARHRLD